MRQIPLATLAALVATAIMAPTAGAAVPFGEPIPFAGETVEEDLTAGEYWLMGSAHPFLTKRAEEVTRCQPTSTVRLLGPGGTEVERLELEVSEGSLGGSSGSRVEIDTAGRHRFVTDGCGRFALFDHTSTGVEHLEGHHGPLDGPTAWPVAEPGHSETVTLTIDASDPVLVRAHGDQLLVSQTIGPGRDLVCHCWGGDAPVSRVEVGLSGIVVRPMAGASPTVDIAVERIDDGGDAGSPIPGPSIALTVAAIGLALAVRRRS